MDQDKKGKVVKKRDLEKNLRWKSTFKVLEVFGWMGLLTKLCLVLCGTDGN